MEERTHEKDWDDRYDVLKKVIDIESSIKKDITSDFTLAKLDESDKTGIIEMTGDAYFSKRIVQMYTKMICWDYVNGEWIRRKLSKDEVNFIVNRAEILFNTFMMKILMTVTLNRNVNKNWLLELVTGSAEKEAEQEQEKLSMFDKMKGVVSNEEQRNEV